MDPTDPIFSESNSIDQPPVVDTQAINEIPGVQPVDIVQLSVPERLARIEQALNIN